MIMQAVLLFLLLLLGNVSSELYHITPSNVTCPSTSDSESVPCLTLSQFLNNSNIHISFSTSLIFLLGNHTLEAELAVDNINAFSMLSNSVSSLGTVRIICGYNGTFTFENITSVHISGLTFYGCTGNALTSVDHFFLEDSNFIGHDSNKGTALELFKTTARLVRNSFRFNIASKLYDIDCPQYQNHGQAQAGGAIVSIKSNVTTISSVFEGNSAVAGGAIFHTSCNVTVVSYTIGEYVSAKNPYTDCRSQRRLNIQCGGASEDSDVIDINHINITHCEFITNYATGPGIGGGAVYVVASNVIFSHSEFFNNTVLRDNGGVLFAAISSIVIKHTAFINNSAQFDGGVVLAHELADIDITHSNFVNNSATGGILALENDNNYNFFYVFATVAHSQFSNNNASVGGIIAVNVIEDAYGQITVNISHSEFINNFAKKLGGVVSILNDDTDANSESDFAECGSILNIIHSRFINNKAETGGVIYVEDCDTYVTVSHSIFIENSCSSEGGIMAIHANRRLNITHSEFINNRAQNAGVAFVKFGSIFIAHNKFINNIALSGGVLFIQFIADIKIVYNLFIQNTATDGQGGVMATGMSPIHSFQQSKTVTVMVIVSSNEFINNSAETNGGVLQISKYNISISFCKFINNSANVDGGVLWSDSSDVEIIGNKFLHNKVLKNGGAIYALKATLKINNNSFDHNVGNDGGAIYVDQINTEIIKSIFENNRAENDGGTILTKEAVLAINESQFYHNSAGRNGGVASILYKTLNVHGSSFTNNQAGNDGGVLSLFEVNATIYTSDLLQNSASHDGGVINAYESVIDISAGCHFSSNTAENDGGVIQAYKSITDISECYFNSNSAKNDGGVINGYQRNLTICEGNNFNYNRANNDGGVIHSYQLHMLVIGNGFEGNNALNRGGVSFIYQGSSVLAKNIFSYSKADEGGVIYADQGNLTIENISCVRNEANEGGVVHMGRTNVTIKHSAFSRNSAISNGGVWFTKRSNVYFQEIYFTSNTAKTGGSIYSNKCKLRSIGPLFIHNTTADIGAMYLYGSTAQFNGKTEISISIGSCLIYNCNITFWGYAEFINCSEQITNDNPEMLEGGAMTVFKSVVNFHGTASFINNDAKNGGAIQATESKIYVHDVMTVTDNSAVKSGGGIHLDMSELHCQFNCSFTLSGNSAIEKGGGIHAFGSIININGDLIHSDNTNNFTTPGPGVFFIENKSKKGGGLYLEMNAKLYILKSMLYSRPHYSVNFVGNSADYGGAVYVSDDSNSGLCDPNYTYHFDARECLIQIIAVQSSVSSTTDHKSMRSIFFSQNSADVSGSSLFGGLIDRCKVLHFTEKLLCSSNSNKTHQTTVVDGISYLEDITNIDRLDIGSEPVQLCFCNSDDLPDCNYQPQTIRIAKGKRFSVSLVAVDQVNHPVNATVYSSLNNAGGGFKKDQAIQNTTKACSELNFNLVSPYDKEELIMFAKGPCMSSPQSQQRVSVHFTACDFCPIGFEKHVETTVCECICDSRLAPYITIGKCNASTELLEREGNFWLTYIETGDNTTSGYVIYPHCPFNYCVPPTSKIKINLNVPGGDNMQCVDGRSGLLCGVCSSNVSLSLGSSRCVPCLDQWPIVLATILVASFIAGIALVALLLVLNFTVAVGTLNGIIFYANIIAANSSTFLPFTKPNFITVFISWLNLEVGFDTCFFPGMDAYWKTLLQLAFPMYVIFLVVMVIIISEHSTRFARLVAKKNPVATLATLILLSYSKFLNTVIMSLSFAILHYPDGSNHWVWLPDATVQYLKGKHIVLFVTAILIISVGVVYTALLFSWQLLLRHQDKKVFMWTKHQKLCHFIEPYHAPYTFEQRYWTGLLLLARVLVYIVSAVNVSGDPRVALVSTVIVVTSLPIIKSIMERKIYKTWLIGFIEMIMYINIIAFAAFTWYTFDAKKNQTIVAYISVMFTFALLLAVIAFHILQYTGLLSIIQKIAKKLLAFKNNCIVTYGRWHVRIPGNENSEPLITQSSVEIPKFLESLGSTELELSTSTQYTQFMSSTVKVKSDGEAFTSSPKGTCAGDDESYIHVDKTWSHAGRTLNHNLPIL